MAITVLPEWGAGPLENYLEKNKIKYSTYGEGDIPDDEIQFYIWFGRKGFNQAVGYECEIETEKLHQMAEDLYCEFLEVTREQMIDKFKDIDIEKYNSFY